MLSKNAKSQSPAVSCRPPIAIYKRLDSLAKETGRTKSFYVNQAVKKYLEELEDIYLADRVIEQLRVGKEKIYSSAEIRKDLGLDN